MRVAISITGMHCDGCVEAIRSALARMPGILEASVRVGEAVVAFDETKISRAEIIAAIRAAGAFEIRGFSTPS